MKPARRSATVAPGAEGAGSFAATICGSVFISTEAPDVVHERQHLPCSKRAVTVGVLCRGVELGYRLAERRNEDERVVAEAGFAARRFGDLGRPATGGDERLGIVGAAQRDQR